MSLGIDERGVATALGTKSLDVHLCHLHLRLKREALTLCQQDTVFKYHRIAAIHNVLRRFTKAAAGIDIAADGSGTLLGEQRTQIGMFTNELIAGREVQHHLGTCQCQVIAWRDRCPHVLTDFHAELHAACRLEQLGNGRQFNGTSCQIDFRRLKVLRRGKPTLLVELVVVGQVGLRHKPEDGTLLHDDGDIEQQAACLHGHTDHSDDVELTGVAEQMHQPFLRLL